MQIKWHDICGRTTATVPSVVLLLQETTMITMRLIWGMWVSNSPTRVLGHNSSALFIVMGGVVSSNMHSKCIWNPTQHVLMTIFLYTDPQWQSMLIEAHALRTYSCVHGRTWTAKRTLSMIYSGLAWSPLSCLLIKLYLLSEPLNYIFSAIYITYELLIRHALHGMRSLIDSKNFEWAQKRNKVMSSSRNK